MKRNFKWSIIMVCIILILGSLTACGSNKESATKDTAAPQGKKVKIGYVVNYGSHEWYQNIIKGAEDTAKSMGYEFTWEDSNLKLDKQISQAEDLLAKGVNVLILSPVDPNGMSTIMEEAKAKGVPVIAESSIIPGNATEVGIIDMDAGEKIGKWAGEFIKKNFKDKAKVLIVGLPALQSTRDRGDGFKKGLKESGANYDIVQEVDGKGGKDDSLRVSTDAITAHKDINVIYGINDNSALGGQQAYQEAGLDMSKLLTLGFGVEGVAGKTALSANGPYKAGLAMFPEYVGKKMIEVAAKAAAGEKLEERTVTPTDVMTPENLKTYYDKVGDSWKIKFDAVNALLKK